MAEAMVRYWWMRRNGTGCESSAAPRAAPGVTGSRPSAVRAAVSWSRARNPRPSRALARAGRRAAGVGAAARAAGAHRQQVGGGRADMRVVGRVDPLLGGDEPVQVEEVE